MSEIKAATKKRIFNGLMVGGIVIIVAAVFLGVASLQGWFGIGKYAQAKYADAPVLVQNKVGYVNVERSGIAYSIKDGDILTDGDIVFTGSGSRVELAYGEGQIEAIGENREVKVKINSETHRVSFQYVNDAGETSQNPGQASENGDASGGKEASSDNNAQANGYASTGSASSSASNASDGSGASGSPGDGGWASDGGSSEASKTCTISIRCLTILDNMKNLEPGKEKFVPANGIILAPSTVEFTEGETVFDVLNRVCKAAGIQIEYSWTPLYGSYYIEGINHLYEFDCGRESGWMYQVNGWYPNYGCSSYTLHDGDYIEWNYTCNGLGADLGAPMDR